MNFCIFATDLIRISVILRSVAAFLVTLYGTWYIKENPYKMGASSMSTLLHVCIVIATAGGCVFFMGTSIYGYQKCEVDTDDDAPCNELHGTGYVESMFYVPGSILLASQTVLNFYKIHVLILCWVMMVATLLLFICKFGIDHALPDIFLLLILAYSSVMLSVNRKATYIATQQKLWLDRDALKLRAQAHHMEQRVTDMRCVSVCIMKYNIVFMC